MDNRIPSNNSNAATVGAPSPRRALRSAADQASNSAEGSGTYYSNNNMDVLEDDVDTFLPWPGGELGIGAEGIEDGTYLLDPDSALLTSRNRVTRGAVRRASQPITSPGEKRKPGQVVAIENITPMSLMALAIDVDRPATSSSSGRADMNAAAAVEPLSSYLGADAWLAPWLAPGTLDSLTTGAKWTPMSASMALVAIESQAEPAQVNEPCAVPAAHADVQSISLAARDGMARREVAEGQLQVHILANVQALQRKLEPAAERTLLERLLGVRNVFARGLEAMPRAYITRIVFDVHHRTLALFRDKQVRECEAEADVFVLCCEIVGGRY